MAWGAGSDRLPFKDKVYIEQVQMRRSGTSTVLKFNLGTSNGVVDFYRTVTSIRAYGCSTFTDQAETAVPEVYRLMSIPSKWSTLTKGYNAVYAAERAARRRAYNPGGEDLDGDYEEE